MKLTEDQIKDGLKEKIKSLEEQIEQCKVALKAFGEDVDKPEDLNLFVSDKAMGSDKVIVSKDRKTVRARVEGLLADTGYPLTSREIMDHLNKTYKKKYTYSNFSGNFSTAYRKKSSNIEKYEFNNLPVELRVTYGLKSWFIGDELKGEYKKKFYDAHSG